MLCIPDLSPETVSVASNLCLLFTTTISFPLLRSGPRQSSPTSPYSPGHTQPDQAVYKSQGLRCCFSLLRYRPLLTVSLASSFYPHSWQHELHTLSLAWQVCHQDATDTHLHPACHNPLSLPSLLLLSRVPEHFQGDSPVFLSQNRFSYSVMIPHPVQKEASLFFPMHVSTKPGGPPERTRCFHGVPPSALSASSKAKKTTTAFKPHLNYSSAISLHATITYAKQQPPLRSIPTVSHKSS